MNFLDWKQTGTLVRVKQETFPDEGFGRIGKALFELGKTGWCDEPNWSFVEAVKLEFPERAIARDSALGAGFPVRHAV
jgi:hypothetical protein